MLVNGSCLNQVFLSVVDLSVELIYFESVLDMLNAIAVT